MNEPSIDYNITKVSFHPRDKIALVIDMNGKRLYGDVELKSMFYDEFIVPFIQIVVPNDLNILDKFNKTKYDTFLNIDDNIRNNKTISLEIYIHKNGIELDQDVLFEAHRNFIGTYYYNNCESDYTCTIFLSTIDTVNNDLIVVLNGANAVIIYELISKIKN